MKTFINTGNATGFFDRMGVERGSGSAPPVTTQYIDFNTGEVVEFEPPEFSATLEALKKFLSVVEPWEHLMQPGYFDFPEPEDIPADLLIPFGDFITKHGLQDAMPIIYPSTGLGLGNLTNELTLFTLQAFGASMARSVLGLQESFVPASGRNQDIYDAVAHTLGDDVLYSSTVVKAQRTENGVVLTVRSSKTKQLTHITAQRLLIAIEPTPENTSPFDLDREEREVLSKFTYTREYTGIVDNAAFAVNLSYFNLPQNAAPDNVLSYPEAPFTARIDYMGSGHYFRVTVVGDNDIDAHGAKKLVQEDFGRLLDAGILARASNCTREPPLHWVDFSAHGPMHARVSAQEVHDGFFQKLYALQGSRSTWWTGGAWSVNFQTTLWEYDDIIIPKLLEGLD